MPKDHYVQRALMKFWGRWIPARNTWEGEAWCFDFKARTLVKRSTRDLFARESLHSNEVETKLNRLIERPLSKFLQAGGFDGGRTLDWTQLQATALAFLIQPARALDGIRRTANVDGLFMMNDETLGWYAQKFLKNNEVGTFTVPETVQLYLPETGWYPFPVVNAKPVPFWGVALPLTTRTVLFAIPKGFELADTELNVASLSNFSIGMGRINQVIVSAATYATHGETLLREKIPELRAEVEARREWFKSHRDDFDRGFKIVGLEPPPMIADFSF